MLGLPYGTNLAAPLPLSVRAGLVSLWRFENAANLGADALGGNTMTPFAVTQTVGKIGNGSLYVSASSSYMFVNSNAALQAGSGDCWITAWVKGTAGSFIAGKSLGSTPGGTEFTLEIISNQLVTRGSDGTTLANAQQAVTLIDNSWHFVFGWFNRSTKKVYSQQDNGTVVTSAATLSSGIRTGTASFNLATDAGGIKSYDGIFDEVAWGKCPAGSLGDGSAGTLANTISTTLYNSGAGLAWSW